MNPHTRHALTKAAISAGVVAVWMLSCYALTQAHPFLGFTAMTAGVVGVGVYFFEKMQ